MATQAKTSTAPIQVTEENFRQAESDLYFRNSIKLGGDGKFHHIRGAMPIDNQTVIRANRDTLYSSALFDLDAGPVTITLPDPGGRFMSLQVFDEEQYSRADDRAPHLARRNRAYADQPAARRSASRVRQPASVEYVDG